MIISRNEIFQNNFKELKKEKNIYILYQNRNKHIEQNRDKMRTERNLNLARSFPDVACRASSEFARMSMIILMSYYQGKKAQATQSGQCHFQPRKNNFNDDEL